MDVSKLWGRIRDYVTIGLAVTTLACGAGWYITDLKLDAAVSGRAADRAAYAQAQAEYEAKALREKEEIERKNREEAKKADAAYNDLLGKYRTNLVRYQAAQRQSSRPNLSVAPGTSDGDYRSRRSPQLPAPEYLVDRRIIVEDSVIIPMADAEICAVNTARLIVTRDWVLNTHSQD